MGFFYKNLFSNLAPQFFTIMRRMIPLTAMLIAVFFWSTTFIAVKFGLREISSLQFLFWRFFTATLAMGGYMLLTRPRWTKYSVWKGSILGALLVVVIYLETLGLETITASLSSFTVAGATVLFVFFLTSILNKRKITFLQLFLVLLCIIGLGLVTLDHKVALSIGVVYTLIAAFIFSFYVYAVEKMGTSKDGAMVTWMQLFIFALAAGLGCLIKGDSLAPPSLNTTWYAILICAIPASCIAFWIQMKYQEKLGSVETALVFSLEPVFSSILASILLYEQLNSKFYIGASLILFSVVLLQILSAKQKK